MDRFSCLQWGSLLTINSLCKFCLISNLPRPKIQQLPFTYQIIFVLSLYYSVICWGNFQDLSVNKVAASSAIFWHSMIFRTTWNHPLLNTCAKATCTKLLGFLRRTTLDIGSVRTHRTLYLAVVGPALGYATRVCCSQTVKLIEKLEKIQRRVTKYILGLPFLCAESYKERLLSTDLLPLCYWHEFLDLVFFYKATPPLPPPLPCSPIKNEWSLRYV